MRKILYGWLLIITVCVNSSFVQHPFYVSYIEITQDNASKNLQLSVRIFTDDFEKTLEKNYKTSVDLTNPKDKKKTEGFIKDYIQKHVIIKANKKGQTLNYIGYEIQEGSAWCYFETANAGTITSLNVSTDLLHDYIDQQINIVHYKIGSKDETKKLDYPKTNLDF